MLVDSEQRARIYGSAEIQFLEYVKKREDLRQIYIFPDE